MYILILGSNSSCHPQPLLVGPTQRVVAPCGEDNYGMREEEPSVPVKDDVQNSCC